MLRFLFPRLTPRPSAGEALFDAVTAEARQPHWYREGKVPDTIDGRFAVLATVAALVTVRLEAAGPDGDAASVALTERFIAVMESEHRELGLGDPALGKTVRKLVRSLAKRVGLWRASLAAEDFESAARRSLYGAGVDPAALAHSAAALRDLWRALERRSTGELMQGCMP